MSQQPVKKDPFKKFNFDEYILDADRLAESFLSPKRRMKLDTDSEGLELIKKKKKAFDETYSDREMFPIAETKMPITDLPSDLVSYSKSLVSPEKARQGKFVMVKTKIGKNRKTRIY